MMAICRTYRFKAGETKEEFNTIVQVTFNSLLSIGQRLVGETSIEAGEMLRLVVKTYKHAIYVWCTMVMLERLFRLILLV